MAPCSGNVITPRMIRTGQVHIGDQIEFERDDTTAVSGVIAEAGTLDEENSVQTVSARIETSEPGEKTSGSAEQEQAVPAAATFSEENPYAADTARNPMPDTAKAETDNGVSLRRQHPQKEESYSQQLNPTAAQTARSNMMYTNTAQIPLAFQQMTDYVNSLENTGTQSPTFNVPSNPLIPPEYEQTIDYDSIQYMNGFLRTQIGRYMRVEQLIGAGTLEDRYGFLVGVGNNYLLLQDISNGNVSIIDIYTVKYVYIYFGEPVFPNLPFGNSGR